MTPENANTAPTEPMQHRQPKNASHDGTKAKAEVDAPQPKSPLALPDNIIDRGIISGPAGDIPWTIAKRVVIDKFTHKPEGAPTYIVRRGDEELQGNSMVWAREQVGKVIKHPDKTPPAKAAAAKPTGKKK